MYCTADLAISDIEYMDCYLHNTSVFIDERDKGVSVSDNKENSLYSLGRLC